MDTNDKEAMDGIIKSMGLTKTQKLGAEKLLEEINAQTSASSALNAKVKTPTIGDQLSDQDTERVLSTLREYFSCFAISGYDLNGNKFSTQYAPTDLHWDVIGKLLIEDSNEWTAREQVYKQLAFKINLGVGEGDHPDEEYDD